MTGRSEEQARFLRQELSKVPEKIADLALQEKCDMILLACSTFNRAAELAAPMINVPILQIDRTMMELAVSCGSRVGMLATLPTTIPASERLLYKAAEDAGKEITVKFDRPAPLQIDGETVLDVTEYTVTV